MAASVQVTFDAADPAALAAFWAEALGARVLLRQAGEFDDDVARGRRPRRGTTAHRSGRALARP